MINDLSEAVKADFSKKYSQKIDKLAIYIKPEDGKAYYVVNDDITDSIDL